MKKILFLFLFSIIFLFAFPLSGFAISYEVTVTITSVKIPERAGMILAPNRPNTEFMIPRAYFTIVDKNDAVARRLPGASSGSYYNLLSGLTEIITFPYNALFAPYTLNVEAMTPSSPDTYYNVCAADCSTISKNSGYYTFQAYPKFRKLDSAFDYITCPNMCAGGSGYEYNIALSPENVFQDTVWGNSSYRYWRSPPLLTIP